MPSRNAIVCCCLALCCGSSSLAAELIPPTGHRVWDVVTFDVQGPEASEEGEPNPFCDVRMTVTVSCNGADYAVPGYFAADGRAAETGAKSGNVWRAHFVPDRPGEWSYTVAMRGGRNIALNRDSGSALPGDGNGGQFTVADNDGAAGILQYVGSRYLRWSGNGRYYLKSGVDSPENLLGYSEFDGTDSLRVGMRPGEARGGRLHTFEPHVRDWREGDPTWQGGKGKGIIGAVNYLASQGVNSVYFVTLNIAGDGQDVWPWTSPDVRDRFDCSKLDQWETVFAHLDRNGMLLHFVFTETENESLFEVEERSDFADARKLYYRELIARFAHHHAIEWNIGEENGSTPKDAAADAPDRENTDAQRKAFAEYIRYLDNYQHPIVVHTHPGNNWYEKVYPPLLGHAAYEGASLQVSGGDVYKITKTWVQRSEEAGRPWFICLDELGPADTGVKPDADDPTHDDVRTKVLWANLMAGGSGCEWYFGYKFPHNDLNCEDFRSRQEMYRQTRLATEFFQRHVPFAEMTSADDIVRGVEAWCLAKTGDVYLVYLPQGSGEVQVRLPRHDYDVRWFSPRAGGELQAGSHPRVTGGDWTAIGKPPGDNARDWAVLLTRIAGAVSGTIRVRGAAQENEIAYCGLSYCAISCSD